MEAAPTVTRIFTAHEAAHLFKHLDHLERGYSLGIHWVCLVVTSEMTGVPEDDFYLSCTLQPLARITASYPYYSLLPVLQPLILPFVHQRTVWTSTSHPSFWKADRV